MSEITRNQDSFRSIETRSEHESPLAPTLSLVPGWVILAHPDGQRVGERAPLPGLAHGGLEELSRIQPDFAPYGSGRTRSLADPFLSRRLLRLIGGADGTIRLEVETQARNEVRVGGEILHGSRTLDAETIRQGVVVQLGNRTALCLTWIDPVTSSPPRFGLVGDSPKMVDLRRQIARLAKLDIPVLIRGETGTGKELVARALHHASRRQRRPFVPVNLGAIPPTLAAAEFFGAARGAFTGADRSREGFFLQAEGGTLFLDEIAEAPGDVQALLLRALESGEVQPIGGGAVRRVDVRLLAATDADLDSAVESGRFRAPLLHRLASFELRLPPLRARREDVGPLLRHFLLQELTDLGCPERLETRDADARPWLPASLIAQLAQYDWPGNVRELRNVARTIAVTSYDRSEVVEEPVLERLAAGAGSERGDGEPGPAGSRDGRTEAPLRKAYRHPDEMAEAEILAALRAHGFRLKPAAATLGISRTSLYAWVEKNPRVRKARDLSREEIVDSFERHPGDFAAVRAEFEVSDQGLKRRIKQLGLDGLLERAG